MIPHELQAGALRGVGELVRLGFVYGVYLLFRIIARGDARHTVPAWQLPLYAIGLALFASSGVGDGAAVAVDPFRGSVDRDTPDDLTASQRFERVAFVFVLAFAPAAYGAFVGWRERSHDGATYTLQHKASNK